jgi:WD40 repeat protein/serine/threonine protein kinase
MSERDIFIAALQKEDPAERQAYLDAACAGRPELRQQVDNLLQLHEGAGSFLERPAAGSATTAPIQDAAKQAAPPEAAGAVIGRYKLLQQVGEGGMGAVWMAQQTEPVKRLVALKLIKAGMDSKQVLARFEQERQALALMDHPNIAKVFDAGQTEAGRPYFVMELVKGVPITKYCDEHRLTPRQRLELFVPVCQAVQHAHQKGIIHRDLKPSNVLVALYDGQPVPKVIDFGVAKAVGQPLTDKTLVTGLGTIVGTLEYMSPEQAEINQLDIDTRSDIYALGVLLYELLVGSPPFSRRELEKAGMLAMLRMIREQEPSKPSNKLSTADGLPTLAANRGMEPAKLTKLVRGELDWIVMKALEKDRNRRYESANGFAQDVQRYLADEPVQACPPSLSYRLGKLLRRHKGPVLAVSLVALALVGGIIGTTGGMLHAVAETAEKEKARTLALQESDRAGKAEKQAKDDRNEAITQRNLARNQRYDVGMKPIWRLWQEGSHVQVRQELDALRPGPDEEEDLRGFEWHYQDRLCRGALRTLKGHHAKGEYGTVQAVAFSPDGRWLASGGGGGGSRDSLTHGELIVWDLATGEEVRRFKGENQGMVLCVAFSPDGKTLASVGDYGRKLQVRDAADGRVLHNLESSVHDCESLAFSPDGGRLVVAGHRKVEVWEVSNGQRLARWETQLVSLAAFHPEGNLLTVTPAAVTLHDPATGNPLRSFRHGLGGKSAVNDETERPNVLAAVSPDFRWLALSGNDGVWVWDLTLGRKRYHLMDRDTREESNGLAFSPDGQRLAWAGTNGTVVVWDLWDLQYDHPRRNTIQVVEAGVVAVAFSPDGLRLATAGYDGIIRILDSAATGQETRLFRRLPGRKVVFTPDGGKFLVLPEKTLENQAKGMPSLHDAVSGHKLPGPAGGEGPVAYSGDGRWLASGCKEGIRVWEADTCREAKTIRTSQKCERIAFTTDGRLVSLTRGLGQGFPSDLGVKVQAWDPANGRELGTFTVYARSTYGMAILPDGRRLVTVNPERNPQPGAKPQPPQLNVWDLDKGQSGSVSNPSLTLVPHGSGFQHLACSPDGKLLATAGYDPAWAVRLACGPSVTAGRGHDQTWSVKLWDAATGQEVRSIPWPREPGASGGFGPVAFSPDGRFLGATGSGLVKVWDVTGGQEVFTHKFDGYVHTLDFGPDGGTLAVRVQEITRVLDLPTGRERFALKGPGNFSPGSLAFSADGKHLATGGQELRVWDAVTGAELHSRTEGHPGEVASMAVSPVGGLLATGGVDQTVRVWELDSWNRRWTFQGHAGAVAAVAFSPDGRLLASANGVGQVWIWELADRQAGVVDTPLHRLRCDRSGEVALAFSPDGQRLVAVSADGSLKVWDVARGQELSSGKLAKEQRGGVAFSPDGQLLAYCGEDCTVRLWDLSKGQEVRAFTVDDQERRGRKMSIIEAVAFSPDGQRLAAAGAEVLRLWDMRTFQEVYTISPAYVTRGLAFSPDSGRLIGVGNVVSWRTGNSTVGSFRGVKDTTVLWDGRPLTPEREAEREAVALLDQLFNRPLPRKDVLDRLRSDPALSEPVRQAALRLADHYREADPQRLAEGARLLARSPGLAPAYHAQALSQAEAACALAPDDGYCLTALGMAQYRLGKYQEALETLTRAERLNTRRNVSNSGPLPADMALLALVHHRLGNKEEARKFAARQSPSMPPLWRGPETLEEAQVLGHEIALRLHGSMGWPGGEPPPPAPGEKPKP